MKIKYYIRGFGAGIIVTTLVLMVSSKLGSNNKDLVAEQETTTGGSVLAYTTEAETDEKETKPSETTQLETTINETTQNELTQKETTAAQETQATTVATEATTEAVTQATVDANGNVEIVFKNVYTAAEAAKILYDAGIVDDEYEFYMFMYTAGYDRRIKDGVYEIKPNDTYDNIAKIITRS